MQKLIITFLSIIREIKKTNSPTSIYTDFNAASLSICNEILTDTCISVFEFQKDSGRLVPKNANASALVNLISLDKHIYFNGTKFTFEQTDVNLRTFLGTLSWLTFVDKIEAKYSHKRDAISELKVYRRVLEVFNDYPLFVVYTSN